MLLLIASAITTTLGIVFINPILILMNTPEEIMKAAAEIFKYYFVGLIFSFGYNAISAILRGLGIQIHLYYFFLYNYHKYYIGSSIYF